MLELAIFGWNRQITKSSMGQLNCKKNYFLAFFYWSYIFRKLTWKAEFVYVGRIAQETSSPGGG